jgi:hypothetical protein
MLNGYFGNFYTAGISWDDHLLTLVNKNKFCAAEEDSSHHKYQKAKGM